VVDSAIRNVDADAEQEDVLDSLMAGIDVAGGDAAETWHDHSDAGCAAIQASGASDASHASGDRDSSATRAFFAAPVVGGRGKAAMGVHNQAVVTFDKTAYEDAFGDTPYNIAVTTLLDKYAKFMSRLMGHQHCQAPMTVAESVEVGEMAKSFVLGYMVLILCEWFRTKVHKLLAHIMAAIKQHGALTNGGTGGNEALHGQDKQRYGRTSGRDDAFRTHVLRVGQGRLRFGRAWPRRRRAGFGAVTMKTTTITRRSPGTVRHPAEAVLRLSLECAVGLALARHGLPLHDGPLLSRSTSSGSGVASVPLPQRSAIRRGAPSFTCPTPLPLRPAHLPARGARGAPTPCSTYGPPLCTAGSPGTMEWPIGRRTTTPRCCRTAWHEP